MITVRSKKRGNIWLAVAEDDEGRVFSSDFSMVGKQKAVDAVIESLPAEFGEQIRTRGSTSPALEAMYQIYLGKTPKKEPNLDMRFISPFNKRVYQVTRKIPRGFVSTYGMIATEAGNRRAGRAVGNAMRSNPFAPFVPCHRVALSTMKVGRYSLSSNPHIGPAIKRAILLREGVEFDGDKISMKSLWRFKRRN